MSAGRARPTLPGLLTRAEMGSYWPDLGLCDSLRPQRACRRHSRFCDETIIRSLASAAPAELRFATGAVVWWRSPRGLSDVVRTEHVPIGCDALASAQEQGGRNP